MITFYIVDVFSEKPYAGNQLAVIPDARDLSGDQMQEIAREMHFSETSFIDPVDLGNHVYSVRIFTPEHEVPFAGHPVLGTSFIIRQEIIRSTVEEITLALPVGGVPVLFPLNTDESSFIWMRQNPPVFTRTFDPGELAQVLSLPEHALDSRFPVQEVSTGLPFIIVPLISRDVVRSAKVNSEAYHSLISKTAAKAVYIFCSEPYHPENNLNARMFADYYGIPEDPATGSAAGCVAAYLVRNRYFEEFPSILRIEQGYEIHRPSLVLCKTSTNGDDIRIEVGGTVVLVARGELV